MDKKRALVAFTIYLAGSLGLYAGYKILYAPYKEKIAQVEAEKKHNDEINQTIGKAVWDEEINVGIDSFSGYGLLRSSEFTNTILSSRVKVDLIDDQANYSKRLNDLKNGQLDMAVFTIDALIKASVEMDDFPATIVAVLDETVGADAMVGSKVGFPNIDSLNSPETKFVCVKDSPSETLARIVISQFNLDRLNSNPFEFCTTIEEVQNRYQKSRPTDKNVFVLWEPLLTQVKENPDFHVIVDSSKFRGYIVDVLVARRGYLVKNPASVEKFLKSYLTSLYQKRDQMKQVLLDDARSQGINLTDDAAANLTKGIWWKNTQENFGHFGLTTGSGLQHIAGMVSNISRVLRQTGSISKDPQANLLYYDGVVSKLLQEGWHPGVSAESVQEMASLEKLTDEQWELLKPVGTLQVPRLIFPRGQATLTEASQTTLTELAERLKTWPSYYLEVRGNSVKSDNPNTNAANMKLAKQRADKATEWLIQNGVDQNRIRATSSANGSFTVAFVLGEMPY